MPRKSLILCDCSHSQSLDSDGLAGMCDVDVTKPFSELCGRQAESAAKAIAAGDAIICCAQEERFFDALADDLGVTSPATLDLRDRAGWTEDTASTLPKMSALVAEALLPSPSEKSIDIVSEGLCLILGNAETVLPVADNLKDHLGVTVLLESADSIPETREFDVVVGRLNSASGAFGQFRVRIDQLQQIVRAGRGEFALSDPRDGAVSDCDIILDLRGGNPLFSAPDKRDGYLRADPAHPPSVAAAMLAASHLTGTFEKPLYVKTEPLLCAHSRAEQTGCTRCLDLCPTGAISPDGDHVTVDPMICAGCGACSAACPSGAISYDSPPVELIFRRIQTLAKAYTDAGGTVPRLLAVNAHGSEMIRLAARHGRGLPANVIPLEVSALNGFGHAEMVAALAAGFVSVSIVPGPGTDRDALTAQMQLAQALTAESAISLLDTTDPDELADMLYADFTGTPCSHPVRPIGTRRQIVRQSARALHPDKDLLPLPDGAPYGAVLVDQDSCTLCLSCVSLCPSGALGDNPDQPQLRFQEDACLQCGLCAQVCPEDAITYAPRLNLADAALTQDIINEEEPFACVECGALFGVKSTIEKITEKLTGHSMFTDENKLRMIQMCDNCRVDAQFHSDDNPFQGGKRPRPRTTEDYLSKRRDH